MFGKKLYLVSGAVLLTAVGAALYMNDNTSALAGPYCDDLAKEETYAENNMEHYETLVLGKGEWIFRSKNDFFKKWEVNERTVQYLKDLDKAFSAQNAELVLVMPPVRGLVHIDMVRRGERKKFGMDKPEALWASYEGTIGGLQKAGLNVVGFNRSEVTDDFFYSRDHHWTATAAAMAAGKVADAVEGSEIYKKIPAIEYTTTEKQEPVEFEGAFDKPFEEICGTEIPKQQAKEFVTQPAKQAQGSSALFDDSGEPQVVLLGTSNSIQDTSHANFEGFLKQALSRDVLNRAIIGAGIDSSIISYVNSDHFRNGKPKIVVWEIPGYYELNVMDDKLFNQVIPAAYGTCSSDFILQKSFDDVASGTVKLVDTESMELGQRRTENGETGIIKTSYQLSQAATMNNNQQEWMKNPDDLYLHLNFSEPVEEKFRIEFIYPDGGTKKQMFSKSERTDDNNDYYTLFPAKDDFPAKINMVLPKGFEGRDMEMTICKVD